VASKNKPDDEGNIGPQDLDALALYGEDDGELRPIPDEFDEPGHRRPRRGLFIGGALLAVVLAAGVPYVMMRSEKSVTTPPIINADAAPAKVVPADTPADSDERDKLIYDRVDGAQRADRTKLVTPGDDKVAAAPALSGDDNKPISRVIEPAGPGLDQPAKVGDAPALADHPAPDAAGGVGDTGQISPKSGRAFAAGGDMPAANSKLPAAAPGDPQMAASMRSLLTSLGYYTGPEQDEKDSITLARAFTTWLFHHDLPADTPVTGELIARMQGDLAKGDIRPSILPRQSRKSSLPASWSQKDCQDALAVATKAGSGPIKGVNVGSDGGTVSVSYDEAEWRGKTDAEKMTVVDLVNCTLAGPGGHVIALEIRSNGTNRLLAQWSGGKGLEAPSP